MNKLIATSAFAAMLALTSATGASAFTRNGSKTGPNGNSTSAAAATNCSANTTEAGCTRGTARSGPTGNTVNHQGVTSCADGTCQSGGMSQGPGNSMVTRQGSVSK